jgi:hypothetical protein
LFDEPDQRIVKWCIKTAESRWKGTMSEDIATAGILGTTLFIFFCIAIGA